LGIFISILSSMVSANQLFQYPWFTILVGAVIGVMAVGLMWPPQFSMPAVLNRVSPRQHRLSGSFWIGVLTAVLSTPCTAPLMGAAMAWAVSQEPATALAAFLAIGVGMASPYMLLTIWPAGISRLPKAGPGSVLMKQVMALLLLAAASYFVGTGVSGLLVSPPEPPANTYWWAVSVCTAAAGGWLAYRCRAIDRSRRRRRIWIVVGIATAVLALAMGNHLTSEEPVDWIYYTPARYARATAAGKPVVVVFTAEWCLNCKALEQRVYRHDAVVEMFAEERAIPMKVDLTAPNPDGRALLRSLGQLGIPLVAVWSPQGHFAFVSDFYSARQLVEAVSLAATP
jgi:thiol:disulfide interchange protein DsbD